MQIKINMKEILKLIRDMDMEGITSVMDMSMKDSGLQIRKMDMVCSKSTQVSRLIDVID